MIFKCFDPIPFFFYLIDDIGVVVKEEVEKWSNNDVVSGSCIGVAVDGGVEIDRNHGVMNDPTTFWMRYKANMKISTNMNSTRESMVLRAKNLIKFSILFF